MNETANVVLARRYIQAIVDGATDALREFYCPDAVQEEFPNRLLPNGARRDVPALIEGARRGKSTVHDQDMEIRTIVANGDLVAIELIWTARVSVPLGTLGPNDPMCARFAIFLEFKAGRIWRQRNYDCFDPF